MRHPVLRLPVGQLRCQKFSGRCDLNDSCFLLQQFEVRCLPILRPVVDGFPLSRVVVSVDGSAWCAFCLCLVNLVVDVVVEASEFSSPLDDARILLPQSLCFIHGIIVM